MFFETFVYTYILPYPNQMNHSNVFLPSLKDLEIKQRLQTFIFEHQLAFLKQMKHCCKLLLCPTHLALEVALQLFDHYWMMGACKNDLILHIATFFINIPFVFLNPNIWQILNDLLLFACFSSVLDLEACLSLYLNSIQSASLGALSHFGLVAF